MDQQDWNEVIIRGKRTKEQDIREGNYVAEKKRPVDRYAHKLEQETEHFEHKVSYNLAQAIRQARTAKGWTRKELAQRVNVKVGVIADYKTGKVIPDNALLQKLSRVLGVPLKKNM